MNQILIDENKELMDAYFKLYDATSTIKDKELKRLLEILISPEALSNKAQVARLPTNLRAERILDHFNLDPESYRSLLDIVPNYHFISSSSGVGYRFLIHPRLTDDIYQELIKKASQEKDGLRELETLTNRCIQTVINQLDDHTPTIITAKKKAKKIKNREYKDILRVLQEGVVKINNLV